MFWTLTYAYGYKEVLSHSTTTTISVATASLVDYERLWNNLT